jgi:hypothetical protein
LVWSGIGGEGVGIAVLAASVDRCYDVQDAEPR